MNKLNTVSLLLLIAFLNAFSSGAFSYPSEGLDLDSRNFDYLQAGQNKKAVFFEETSISSSYEQEFSNELSSFGRISELQFSLGTLIKHFGQTTSWAYLRDSRQLLSQHIFPFQFFW
ncbi:hypothetical protein JM83_1353 [Gillisia sp. Hel_I_86]|uniref:hypothetical protein n=1 Tax=Gillisia sp. Hel_I_86 TaxID=1249981 RepID=UPI00119B769D|nr:hypothetical protein [Gillisia sp. Hel_I_86]TVZ26396.1 hypothetical protein JM83_1353 [Gillisia sp. Hel_I_86]